MVELLTLSPQLLSAGAGGLLIVFVVVLIRMLFAENTAHAKAIEAENVQHAKDIAAVVERADRAEQRVITAQQALDAERALRHEAENRAATAEAQLAIWQVGAAHDPASTRLPPPPTHPTYGRHGHRNVGGREPRQGPGVQEGQRPGENP